ncbi:hypothetical protein BUALT_Bualt04G0099000 [Buddleja alternifolia]|uniref:DUF4216 domain-containing protein n=1 Tax=Buddleja alternifolia TaxID=168488 RepID=A0AAV6XMR0_9LAMI|nr:hypothetical protein BUALT_Bualt04G0099000 [Buddleja alternifolia]
MYEMQKSFHEKKDDVREHCLLYGFEKRYKNWRYHGEAYVPLHRNETNEHIISDNRDDIVGKDDGLNRCEICNSSRYKDNGKNTAAKRMRYFSLKQRLQKLFMSLKTASLMRWHADERIDNGKFRHPTDALAWKDFDIKNPLFASDARNIRMGLTSDGFNPFRMMNVNNLQQTSNAQIPEDIRILANGPIRHGRRYKACVVRGFRFRTRSNNENKTTQNSGVMLKANTKSYSSTKDRRPHDGKVLYYGVLTDIIKVQYTNEIKFLMFKCDWVDPEKGVKQDEFKFTLVNFNHLLHKNNISSDEPFILSTQADQVWYVTDPLQVDWKVVVTMTPRDNFDVYSRSEAEPYSNQRLDDHKELKEGLSKRPEQEQTKEFKDLYVNALSEDPHGRVRCMGRDPSALQSALSRVKTYSETVANKVNLLGDTCGTQLSTDKDTPPAKQQPRPYPDFPMPRELIYEKNVDAPTQSNKNVPHYVVAGNATEINTFDCRPVEVESDVILFCSEIPKEIVAEGMLLSISTIRQAVGKSVAWEYVNQEEKTRPPPPSFKTALHSVRKPPAKNIIMKKPIAPMPPTPPKIYKVDPADFRDVVQKLTGATEYQPRRLRDVAPPPLNLSPAHRRPNVHPSSMMPFFGNSSAVFLAETQEEKPLKSFESTFGGLSSLGFSLSPSSLAWCSSILFSPGTLSSFEPSAVL